MPHPRTTLRVVLAAVAAPGIIPGMAAPAAHAAEVAPAAKSVEGHVSDAQHTSFSDVGHQATSTMSSTTRTTRTTRTTGRIAPDDVTGSHLLDSGNTLNNRDVNV